jgi:hypothetical protein
MELTAKENKFISEIGQQIALECVAKGITEPTLEQMQEMFIARCQRNMDICQQYLDGKPWAAVMLKGMAIEVYHDARKRGEIARYCQQIREAGDHAEYLAAVRALDEYCNSNIQ